MAKTALAAEQLRSMIGRLSKDGVTAEDRAALYREAKSYGFDRDALKGAVRFAKMDKAEAQEAWAMLDLYVSCGVLY